MTRKTSEEATKKSLEEEDFFSSEEYSKRIEKNPFANHSKTSCFDNQAAATQEGEHYHHHHKKLLLRIRTLARNEQHLP
jgi:hypothetical protein